MRLPSLLTALYCFFTVPGVHASRGATYDQTVHGGWTSPTSVLLTFEATPAPSGDGILSLNAFDSDLDSPETEYLEIRVEGDLVSVFNTNHGTQITASFTLPLPQLSAYAQDGSVQVLLSPNSNSGYGRIDLTLTYPLAQIQVNIETVTVGNPGNAGEWSGESYGGYGPDRICGSVGYVYNIDKYEVTAGQYTAFLNAVAATDTYGLYSTYMDTANDLRGCNIKRSGSSGDYTYSVASEWADRPVNCVSWGDAARFANWMHNSQPTGAQNASTTEDGSYALNGAMGDAALLAVTRKPNATWVIPCEDEWYKAAYHKNDGVTGNYWDYPTGTDSVPSNALGNPTDPGNNATFLSYTIGAPYYRTEVGAHENSDSPYGTFDQGGNVWEWTEDRVGDSSRVARGGAFVDDGGYYPGTPLSAATRATYGQMAVEVYTTGFRIARVSQPTTVNIETVHVGDPGNAADTRYETPGYGSVGYTYDIGKYEVTAGQYTVFLNNKGGVDTYGLYNTDMSHTGYGSGITRSGGGTVGNTYTYSVAADFVNRPVNYVSYWDSCRFTNWLHNGQGSGDTETGAYTLTPTGITDNTVTRNANWKWAVTSEDEWYKAAYYKGGSTNAGYFDYPTSSDAVPGRDMADASGNNANYGTGSGPYPIDSGKYTTAGGEFQNSASPYGTFDQGGNVWEWNEAVLYGSSRGLRGGSFDCNYDIQHASGRCFLNPTTYESLNIGFRVSKVPEPPTPDYMLVAPGQWGGVSRYGFSGTAALTPMSSIPPSLVNDPISAAFSASGELFVGNRHNNVGGGVGSISRFKIDESGNFTPNGTLTGNGLEAVHSIDFSPQGELFATSVTAGTVSRFRFDQNGTATPNGGFFVVGGIQGLAFTPWGELFVPYYNEVRRFRFGDAGEAVPNASFTIPGSWLVLGLGFGPAEELFLADLAGVVFRYRFDGDHNPVPNGTIAVPDAASVAFSPLGELFVADAATPGGIYRFLFDTQGNAITNGFIQTTSSSPIGYIAIGTIHSDSDGDGVPDASDNCPAIANPEQIDSDADLIGDACDPCPADSMNDPDGDGTCESSDNCPGLANPDQANSDADTVGDACDQCPDTPAEWPFDPATGCPLFSRADFDHDWDVDQEDFAHLQVCITGINRPQESPECADTLLDGDTDVDSFDVDLFAYCLAGANIQVYPYCVP